MELKGKTALITGGSKGIGRAVAESMLAAGMNVGITGRTLTSLNSVADEIRTKYGDRISVYEADVRNYASQENAVNDLVNRYGSLDVIIANAGVGHFAPIDEMTHDQPTLMIIHQARQMHGKYSQRISLNLRWIY